jgi:hypothetical protein
VTSPEVLEEVQSLGESEKDFLRDVGREDLYTLSKGILGYKDVNPATHGAFCRFITNEEKRRRLALMPRGHLKSTTATVSDSVRLALKDPDENRILIAGETATKAEGFLSEIKGHFEKNRLLKELYPEIVPDKFAGPGIQWSTTIASVKRRRVYKEGTFNTIGLGGALVGGHYNRVKADDLIGYEAAKSDAMMKGAIAWVDNLESLLIDLNRDIIDFIGTRWKKKDIYAHVMKFYGQRMAVFLREAIENGVVIFPAKMSMEVYETMQNETPEIWYAQYCNNPLALGQTDFPVGAIRPFRFSRDGTEVIGDKDGNEVRWNVNDLDRVITADPNSGSLTAPDTAAVSCTGVSSDDDVFVLSSWSGRFTPSGFVDKIYETAKRWRPRVIGIEKAGQQNTQHYFEKKAEEEQFYVNVVPVAPRNRNKIDRIRGAIEPILRSRRLYCLPTQTVLRVQVDDFPNSDPIDELDALSYGPEVWRKPYTQRDMARKDRNLKLLIGRRDRRTGY